MQLLVIDADKEIAAAIRRGLHDAGHIVELADNGRDGLFMAASDRFDVVILERALPGEIDGLKLVMTLRSHQNLVPILMLSMLASVTDRIEGLEAGCDDYLPKPFDMTELAARVEALKRRDHREARPSKLVVEDLELDLLTREVRRAGCRIDLLPREYLLLNYLMRHAGQVVTRTMLLENVWNYNFYPQTNVVDMQVSCLRQKVDKPFPRPLIHTVRRAGYMMAADHRREPAAAPPRRRAAPTKPEWPAPRPSRSAPRTGPARWKDSKSSGSEPQPG
ncbi:DNA-binding response regulator [Rhodopila globiformis]|uniref:DNA-binding response regulator n=1 Tax=Rhodopila globiformis TaxID=1071 RepID=A0A2S6N6C4_RHOGL|nr:DNA-binding response regulator [Rhodopila globiformis]